MFDARFAAEKSATRAARADPSSRRRPSGGATRTFGLRGGRMTISSSPAFFAVSSIVSSMSSSSGWPSRWNARSLRSATSICRTSSTRSERYGRKRRASAMPIALRPPPCRRRGAPRVRARRAERARAAGADPAVAAVVALLLLLMRSSKSLRSSSMSSAWSVASSSSAELAAHLRVLEPLFELVDELHALELDAVEVRGEAPRRTRRDPLRGERRARARRGRSRRASCRGGPWRARARARRPPARRPSPCARAARRGTERRRCSLRRSGAAGLISKLRDRSARRRRCARRRRSRRRGRSSGARWARRSRPSRRSRPCRCGASRFDFGSRRTTFTETFAHGSPSATTRPFTCTAVPRDASLSPSSIVTSDAGRSSFGSARARAAAVRGAPRSAKAPPFVARARGPAIAIAAAVAVDVARLLGQRSSPRVAFAGHGNGSVGGA